MQFKRWRGGVRPFHCWVRSQLSQKWTHRRGVGCSYADYVNSKQTSKTSFQYLKKKNLTLTSIFITKLLKRFVDLLRSMINFQNRQVAFKSLDFKLFFTIFFCFTHTHAHSHVHAQFFSVLNHFNSTSKTFFCLSYIFCEQNFYNITAFF